MCSDCEAYGLKKHGLTRSDNILAVFTKEHFNCHVVQTTQWKIIVRQNNPHNTITIQPLFVYYNHYSFNV